MQLFSVVLLYAVISVHKFDCRLFIKGDQWKGHAVIVTLVFYMICIFPPIVDVRVT